MRFFLLFFAFQLIAKSAGPFLDTTDGDPSFLIDGKVNPITGKWNAVEKDLVIYGEEPITIQRWYQHNDWQFVPSFKILDTTPHHRGHAYLIEENTGTKIEYKFTNEKPYFDNVRYRKYVPSNLNSGYTNSIKGPSSARASLQNSIFYVGPEERVILIQTPNGTLKRYHRKKDTYILISEHLPNGNWILYDYVHKNGGFTSLVTSIKTTNPSRTIVYAQADFTYRHERKSDRGFAITGSDGQRLDYIYDRDHHGYRRLFEVYSTSRPTIKYEYSEDKEYLISPTVKSIIIEGRKVVQSNAYTRKTTSVNGEKIYNMDETVTTIYDGEYHDETIHDPVKTRVKELLKPLESDDKLYPAFTFLYQLQQNKTSVFDAENKKTSYIWDDKLRIKQIEKHDRFENLKTIERFSWSPQGNLLAKSLSDESGNHIWLKRYEYNQNNELISERVYGNLSGEGTPLIINEDLTPGSNGVESFGKIITYYPTPFHLIHTEIDDRGVKTEYCYLPNTDLILSKQTFDQTGLKEKLLYTYDANNLLIEESVEMGMIHKIKRITRKKEAPYQGMPSIIEEIAIINGKETLLQKTKLTYTTRAQIEKKEIFDANDHFLYAITYHYDNKGNLSQITDQENRVESFSYDQFGNKISHQHIGNRKEVQFSYDHANRKVRAFQKGDDGIILEESFEYDRLGRTVFEKKPLGKFTKYIYGDFGHLIKKELPESSSISFQVDSFGNTVKEIDALGHTTTISYNSYGSKTEVHYPDNSVEKFLYYPNGTLKTSINQEGLETTFTYDYQNQPLTKTTLFQGKILEEERYVYNGGLLTLKIDAEGNETYYQYDGAGRLISEKFHESLIEYEYDSLGRLKLEKQENLKKINHYDRLDRIIKKEKWANDKLLSWESYTFDICNNKTSTLHFVNGEPSQTTYRYDSLGRITEIINPLGASTKTIYEHTPTLKEITIDPMDLKKITTFNALEKIISIEISKNELIERQNFTYDLLTNLIEHTSEIFNPNRKTRQNYRYDAMGRVIEETEAQGTSLTHTTKYNLNLTGKIKETIKPDGTILYYSYSPQGQITSLRSSDNTIHYEVLYDKLGRKTEIYDHLTNQKIKKTYNPHGQIIQETFDTFAIRNTYDHFNRRTQMTLPDQSSIVYSYNPYFLSEITRQDKENRALYTHQFTKYDESEHLLDENLINDLGTVYYKWNKVGQKIDITSPYGSHKILKQDLVQNILSEQIDDMVHEFTYDDLYQIKSETRHQFLTDGHYCRLKKDNETYDTNELLQIPSHREYDLKGNTTKENGWNFTFDALDRIVEAKNDQIRVQFSYDFEHRRLSKTTHVHNKVLKQYFLYDGEKEIGSIDETGLITELRVLGNKSSELGSAIAIELTRGLFVPIHDLYGNVKYLPQSKNTIIPLTYHYSTFEEEFPSGEYNPWRYGSKRRDIETGLIFFGRRYYSPVHGCWLTKDPIEKTGGTNLYAFVKNNPLRFFDPFGLFTTDRASDAHYFDSHNLASSNFSIGVHGNSELGTVNYYCGINNNRESVESAQLELSKTLGGNYAVDAHWIHNHNLLHGLTLVAATKMKGKKLLQFLAPNLYALEEQNLNASYIYDVIDYQHDLIEKIADKIRALNDPTYKQVQLGFSHGVECLRDSLLKLTEEQRDTLIVITLGGTTLIEKDLAHKVFNIVGSKDYPSRICNLFYDTDKIERKLIPQTETKTGVFGHYFEQPDYQDEIKKIFTDHIENVYKIY